jgi:hypothetical protein
MRSQLRLQERNGIDSAGDGPDGRPPEPPPEPNPIDTYPWDTLATGAEVDAWADANGVVYGPEWDSYTVVEKKEWLVQYYDGARPWEGRGEPLPAPEPEPEPTASFPWDDLATHAEIDAWAAANTVDCGGSGWDRLTLAGKRAWLVDYFGGTRPWEAPQE